MGAKREYRNRPRVEVVVLDALVERADEGMTVLELRAVVDADIDSIETALSNLKDDGLITVENEGSNLLIMPADHVVPAPGEERPDESGLIGSIRDRFNFTRRRGGR
ncbi:DUF6432 family protein [Haloferacaceae archaeon DSL9]